MRMKSWVISGTYNENIRKQIGSIQVSIERRHGAGASESGKRRRSPPVNATIRDDGTWVAIVSAHQAPGNHPNKPKQRAMVVFLDPNGQELWRTESSTSMLVGMKTLR